MSFWRLSQLLVASPLVLVACDGGGGHSHGDHCQSIVDVCHDVDPGSGRIHECHDIGHDSDEAACEAVETECVALCVAAAGDGGAAHDSGHAHGDGGHAHGAACDAISDACHPVDPGSGPIHECHDVAHAGDTAMCEAREAECLTLCASVDAGAGHGGDAGHSH